MAKEGYVREGWIGYRVVTRNQTDPKPITVEEAAHALQQGMQSFYQEPDRYPPYNLHHEGWMGPFMVVAETDTRWILRDDQDQECLVDKDKWIFLSVGDEKA